MDRALIAAPAAAVRAAIARCILGPRASAGAANCARSPALLGDVTLRPHQMDAVARLRTLIADSGGALLADAVGLGKTYVALMLARDARAPLVVAPASLRDMWRRALDVAGVHPPLISFETLSRRGRRHCGSPHASPAEEDTRYDFVIVDEAHHARNPATRRYRALAELLVGARVLLLTATPIHNRRADLASLLALVLGARAHALDDSQLARFVLRRDRAVLPSSLDAARADRIPRASPPVSLALPEDDALPAAILALPPPLPPSDGDEGGSLVGHFLVRQWASSDAALLAALRRRLARARAIESSLDRGVYPSRAELRAWTSDGASQQLAFAELLAPPAREPPASLYSLRSAVAAHASAVRSLLAALDGGEPRDEARATLLRDLCRRHRGERVVAFATFAETVGAMFRRLRGEIPAAALTAAGAVVVGGPLIRREALARFAPLASGVRPPRPADRIELLLTTDLLSEGVSLADASVVVHLDLPWTPARLEQRVGRAARLGAPHERVAVYAFAPPASAEAVLAIERRLREKLRAAGRVVGVAGTILPGAVLSPHAPAAPSPTEDAEAVRRILERWRADEGTAHEGAADESVVAATRCGVTGFVAACRSVGDSSDPSPTSRPVLLASVGAREVSDDAGALLRALAAADGGVDDTPGPAALAGSIAAIERWSTRRAALSATGVADGAAVLARRRVIERIARIARRVPAHRRAALAPLTVGARRAALAPFGSGGEWVLEELARADLPDDAWLRAVRAFGESATAGRDDASADEKLEVVAILLLRP